MLNWTILNQYSILNSLVKGVTFLSLDKWRTKMTTEWHVTNIPLNMVSLQAYKAGSQISRFTSHGHTKNDRNLHITRMKVLKKSTQTWHRVMNVWWWCKVTMQTNAVCLSIFSIKFSDRMVCAYRSYRSFLYTVEVRSKFFQISADGYIKPVFVQI